MTSFQFFNSKKLVLLVAGVFGSAMFMGGAFQIPEVEAKMPKEAKSSGNAMVSGRASGDSGRENAADKKPVDVRTDLKKDPSLAKEGGPINKYKKGVKTSTNDTHFNCENHPWSQQPNIVCHPLYEDRMGCGASGSGMCDTIPDPNGNPGDTICDCVE